jgi:hypothetical protein
MGERSPANFVNASRWRIGLTVPPWIARTCFAACADFSEATGFPDRTVNHGSDGLLMEWCRRVFRSTRSRPSPCSATLAVGNHLH